MNLAHPHARGADQQHGGQQQQQPAPMAPMSQLQASAARGIAAAGLSSGKHGHDETGHGGYDQHKRFKEDESSAADDLIRSQLTGAGSNGLSNI